jgi:hypothetical protein
MPFPYYDRLSKRDRAVYDRSDRVVEVRLASAAALRPIVEVLRQGLETDQRRVVQAASEKICQGITEALGVEPVALSVLAVRPSLRTAELHGLYTRDGKRTPHIRVWMRTLRFRRVVAFRTFLRTLLHEVCHHLDYTYLKLPESFHTEGFFRRESSLFYQLVPREEAAAVSRRRTGQ